MLKLLEFPIHGGQRYDFDCGVAVAWSILKYFKIKVDYATLLKASKICPVDGLSPYRLITLLSKFGIETQFNENKNIRFLKTQINKNKPVIVVIQARKEYKKSWSNSWLNGHYVVVIGYNINKLYVYDPSNGGGIKVYTYDQFYKRWHDYRNNDDYIKATISFN